MLTQRLAADPPAAPATPIVAAAPAKSKSIPDPPALEDRVNPTFDN